MISVTIPVYNTSRYLYQCLNSLSNQDFDDIEFIIVNDGSTDNSKEICEEFAKKDNRFKIINKKNGGLGSARQIGLENARGEYIIVCDSDDWIEPNIYSQLYKKAKETNADIVTCGYYAEYPNGRQIPMQYWFKEENGFVDNVDFLSNGAGSSWVKLIRRSLFYETNSNYEKGINLGEDALIIFKLLKGNPKIAQIKGNYYHYRRLIGENTYTNSISNAQIDQLFFVYKWLNLNYSSDEYEEIKFKKALEIAFSYFRSSDFNSSLTKLFLKKHLPYNRFFKNKLSKKSIFILLSKFLPFFCIKIVIKNLYHIFYK